MDSFICHVPEVVDSPVLFNSPHSGRLYDRCFLRQTLLSWQEIRLSEDCYVDKFLNSAPRYGSVFVEATFPRAFVDVNRSSNEMDPKIIKGLNSTIHSPKVSAGLGVIPRVVGNGLDIYKSKISYQEAENRLRNYYFPYHKKLRELIEKAVQKFGLSIVFDFHSMPHSSIKDCKEKVSEVPQIVLGDCYGSSCDSELFEKAYEVFVAGGFRVERNSPFSGGFITKNYGSPVEKVHVIQVEIDKSLYMNEEDFRLHSGYEDLRLRLNSIVKSLSCIQKPKRMVHEITSLSYL